MHSGIKKRRSFLALILAAGDLRRSAPQAFLVIFYIMRTMYI
jgi:hypothetical protein